MDGWMDGWMELRMPIHSISFAFILVYLFTCLLKLDSYFFFFSVLSCRCRVSSYLVSFSILFFLAGPGMGWHGP